VAQVVTNQNNQQTQARFAAVASHTRRLIASNGIGSNARLLPNELNFYQDELARLETLSRFARSAQIEQLASTAEPLACPVYRAEEGVAAGTDDEGMPASRLYPADGSPVICA